MHAYLLATHRVPPWYFVVYAVAVIAGCLLAAGGMDSAANPTGIVLPEKDFLS